MALYLVTGGAGFIGSNLVHALLERGESVRVFDDFSTGREQNLADVAGKIDLHRGDLRDEAAVKRAMQGVTYVLHQGALPSVPRSVADPITTNQVNVLGTLHVLIAARDAGVKRVVAASSSSIYGDTPTLPKIETMVLSPMSPYAVSKVATEQYLKAFYKTYGLETVGLRYFNVFGPRQDPSSQYSAVIPRFVTLLLAGKPATVTGDGLQSRDFCYIENVVQANLLACTAPKAPGQACNVACNERVTLLEVLELIGKLLGKPVPPPEFIPARASDVKHSLADITLAREVLGYTAPVKFAEGLSRAIEWYRNDSASGSL
jgi:UDP-glucose 4-epimerase